MAGSSHEQACRLDPLSSRIVEKRFSEHTAISEAYTPCEQCQKIFNYWYDIDKWYNTGPHGSQEPSHHSFASLEASADSGCHVCFLFLNSLSLNDRQLLRSFGVSENSKIVIRSRKLQHYVVLEILFPSSCLSAIISVHPTSSRWFFSSNTCSHADCSSSR